MNIHPCFLSNSKCLGSYVGGKGDATEKRGLEAYISALKAKDNKELTRKSDAGNGKKNCSKTMMLRCGQSNLIIA